MSIRQPYSCFFCGLGVGAVAGLLLAPRSGAKTRKVIKDAATEGQAILKEHSSDVREHLAEALNKSKQAVTRAADRIEDVLETGRQAIRG